ncbi:transposase [Collimonas sp. OK242]|uniref:transposase n=1 Tax=Collimonas sp. OK242 TaxID=1798195 RepID=UPI0015A29CE3|nr:transposase [Collimonas sp. OK242]
MRTSQIAKQGQSIAIIQSVTPKRGIYRQHSVAFKRAVVEQSSTSDAAVARIVRQHDVDAHQVFAWREQFKKDDSWQLSNIAAIKYSSYQI